MLLRSLFSHLFLTSFLFAKLFLNPLRLLNILNENDLDSIFGDLEIIVDLNNIILAKLEDRLNQWYGRLLPSLSSYLRHVLGLAFSFLEISSRIPPP